MVLTTEARIQILAFHEYGFQLLVARSLEFRYHIDGLVQERRNSIEMHWSYVFLVLTYWYGCGSRWLYFHRDRRHWMVFFIFIFFISNIFIQGKTFSQWLFSHVALCTHIISTHIKYTKYIKSISRGKRPKMKNIIASVYEQCMTIHIKYKWQLI